MKSKNRLNIKLTALCAVLSALGVVLLLLGSLIEALDISAAILASLLITVAVIEGGGYWPWLAYAVISVISLLLLPNKFAAITFFLTGYYPIIKEKIEKLPQRALAWIIKLVIFNFALATLLVVLHFFFPLVDILLLPNIGRTVNYVIIYALGNAIFVVYDILLTRIVSFYIIKFRDRIGLGKK